LNLSSGNSIAPLLEELSSMELSSTEEELASMELSSTEEELASTELSSTEEELSSTELFSTELFSTELLSLEEDSSIEDSSFLELFSGLAVCVELLSFSSEEEKGELSKTLSCAELLSLTGANKLRSPQATKVDKLASSKTNANFLMVSFIMLN
jgi:hypothetical protein